MACTPEQIAEKKRLAKKRLLRSRPQIQWPDVVPPKIPKLQASTGGNSANQFMAVISSLSNPTTSASGIVQCLAHQKPEQPEPRKFFKTTAFDLWQEECRLQPIVTGSQRLDRAIGNGIPVTKITEFCGPPGSGKTQICMQLCVNVQIPATLGGLDGTAVYIDTNHGFSPERLREIATAFVARLAEINKRAGLVSTESCRTDLSPDHILGNVLCTYVSDSTELLAAVHHLKGLLASNTQHRVRIIVIDSLASVFHHGLPTFDRVRVLYDLLADLDDLSARHECAIVLTNEITTRVTNSNSNQSYLVPALGDTHTHRVAQQIWLARNVSTTDGADDRFVARVTKSLSCAESTVQFKITSDGVRDN